MTDQTGGQTPPGWYPDGSGATRYWDGTAWTEHVQPAAPATPPPPPAPEAPVEQAPAQAAAEPAAAQPAAAQVPAQPAGAEDPLAGAAAPYAGASAGVGTEATHGHGATIAPAESTPFYKKWPVLIAIVVALLLVAAGAVFALGGSDDEDSGTVPSASRTTSAPGGTSSAPAAGGATTPQTASGQFDLNCEPTSKIPGSNNKFPFALTLTTTPDATGKVAISVSAGTSISNNGPTEIEPDRYRFEASVLVNDEPFQLIGPVNTTPAKGEPTVEDIFKANELPLVATLTKAAPLNGGALNVVVTDLWFNNINNGVVGTEELDNTFDSRCNPSPTPNAAPIAIGLSIPAATTP